MPIRTNVIEILEDEQLYERIIVAVNNCYNKKYIQQTYYVTRRELEQIIKFYERNNN